MLYFGFNSRAREGRDKMAMEDWKLNIIVSIHAPAKGATSLRYTDSRVALGFNSRAREGRDRAALG